MPNQYKIGEFSKYLGVTPDFLKHYEQYGLVQPTISESNYRYYPFEKSAEVIECIRLRNWGFSLKEIKHMIQDANLDEILENYRKKTEELQKTMQFYQLLIDEFHRFEQWVTSAKNQWTIQYLDEAIFLPHSNNKSFIQDEKVYPIMEQWIKYLPAVHSCQRIYDCFDQQKEPYFIWGYSITKKAAQQMALPYHEPCEMIPKRKCLVINTSILDAYVNSQIKQTIDYVKSILDKHELLPEGEIHRIVYHYTHEDGVITQHSSLIVPLKETAY